MAYSKVKSRLTGESLQYGTHQPEQPIGLTMSEAALWQHHFWFTFFRDVWAFSAPRRTSSGRQAANSNSANWASYGRRSAQPSMISVTSNNGFKFLTRRIQARMVLSHGQQEEGLRAACCLGSLFLLKKEPLVKQVAFLYMANSQKPMSVLPCHSSHQEARSLPPKNAEI